MKIRRTDESRVSVELCKQDLSAFKIEYENLDLSLDSSKELFISLLKRISKEFYCDINEDSKIIVDSSKDACIVVTLLKSGSTANKKSLLRFPQLIYEFLNTDSILDAAFSASGELLLKKNSLYEKDGRYRLIVYPSGDFSSCLILNEFCAKILSSQIELYETIECWNCICENHALSSLSLRYVL